ncbi:DNA polymerase III subunit chi [Zhongshania sp.]|jgi:DNA polymerase-3 subunit chi|uniref:DNA polymerase III subunit chi n=1 Tax=Zhongshania sp. TaxID=1971902 RepID=UPI002A82F58F|nr:DNA polymerase III subunit chi [Zhongshania sp.]
MTKVDFYILSQGTASAAMLYACRLAEKAYRSGHEVYIHCEDSAAADTLNQQLWGFRDESFIPHSCHPGDNNPVLVGCGDYAGDHCDVLINTAQETPTFFSRFQRLAEIVSKDEASLQASRQRYSFYKNRGYPLHSHTING